VLSLATPTHVRTGAKPAANASQTLPGNSQGPPPFLITPILGMAKYTSVNYVEGCADTFCNTTTGFPGEGVACCFARKWWAGRVQRWWKAWVGERREGLGHLQRDGAACIGAHGAEESLGDYWRVMYCCRLLVCLLMCSCRGRCPERGRDCHGDGHRRGTWCVLNCAATFVCASKGREPTALECFASFYLCAHVPPTHPPPTHPHPTKSHAQSIEGEGHDRYNITLPGFQEELIMQVAAASKGPVIVVVRVGGIR
jgi:hypothetical protein